MQNKNCGDSEKLAQIIVYNFQIRLFWEVFHELSLEDKKKFLLFLTGSDRIPIEGMKAIRVSFSLKITLGKTETLKKHFILSSLCRLPFSQLPTINSCQSLIRALIY